MKAKWFHHLSKNEMMLARKNKKRGSAISIEEKIRFLQQPACYPFPVSEVELRETHMSVVFLVNGYVYKMKKPVQYDLFDHKSLETRRRNSFEELLINKKLAKDIYLDVVPLVISEDGALQLEGRGEAVEWLVKMKRIPDEKMLDYGIKHKCIDEKELTKVAELLTGFYRSASPVAISISAFKKKLERDINSAFDQLENPLFGFSSPLLHELRAGLLAFVEANEEVFAERIHRKKIIDAHGDLRPEHICPGPTAAIIDRLEFSKELRIMDVVEELTFLSMECEILGNRSVGEFFTEVYKRETGDDFSLDLTRFYTIKKACVRAYLVARHVLEAKYKIETKWLLRANAYLQLAERYYQGLM